MLESWFGRTKAEVDQVVMWLTGYSASYAARMSKLDVSDLDGSTRALYQTLTAGAPRDVPDPATLPLLSLGLPADLHAVVHAWTYYGRPSSNSLRAWDVFETWDFSFSVAPVSAEEVRRVCQVLSPGSRTDFPDGPFVQLGSDAGGTMAFAGVRNGATACFGPEDGEDWVGIDGLLLAIEERAEFAEEPALAPFLHLSS